MGLKETIKELFDEYKSKHIFEPRFAHVQIEWDDATFDDEPYDAIIKLNTDVIADEDDEVCYYCEGIDELLLLCDYNIYNPADFTIVGFYGFTEKL